MNIGIVRRLRQVESSISTTRQVENLPDVLDTLSAEDRRAVVELRELREGGTYAYDRPELHVGQRRYLRACAERSRDLQAAGAVMEPFAETIRRARFQNTERN